MFNNRYGAIYIGIICVEKIHILGIIPCPCCSTAVHVWIPQATL